MEGRIKIACKNGQQKGGGAAIAAERCWQKIRLVLADMMALAGDNAGLNCTLLDVLNTVLVGVTAERREMRGRFQSVKLNCVVTTQRQ